MRQNMMDAEHLLEALNEELRAAGFTCYISEPLYSKDGLMWRTGHLIVKRYEIDWYTLNVCYNAEFGEHEPFFWAKSIHGKTEIFEMADPACFSKICSFITNTR
jgi:hypothetical protein